MGETLDLSMDAENFGDGEESKLHAAARLNSLDSLVKAISSGIDIDSYTSTKKLHCMLRHAMGQMTASNNY